MSYVYSKQPTRHSQAHTYLHSALFSAEISHVEGEGGFHFLFFKELLFIGEIILLFLKCLASLITFSSFFFPDNGACPVFDLLRDLLLQEPPCPRTGRGPSSTRLKEGEGVIWKKLFFPFCNPCVQRDHPLKLNWGGRRRTDKRNDFFTHS